MKKIKLCGVSLWTLLAAGAANAAGYTCEELIEYTSCNPGYYISSICPGDSEIAEDVCVFTDGSVEYAYGTDDCEGSGGTYYDFACTEWTEDISYEYFVSSVSSSCIGCPAGSYCVGGTKDTAVATPCAAGTYQPNSTQTSCIDVPAGNYSAVGATEYIACPAGKYQPNAGQTSCLSCPAGSYCETTGLATVSGQCALGSYSFGGASACSSCPATGLTDKNGATVVATTITTGSSSLSACIVGSEYYFTDTKGTYHYKSDCEFDLNLSGETEEKCIALNYLDPLNINPNHNESLGWYWYGEGCELYGNSVTALAPTTEEECAAVISSFGDNYTIWEDGQCKCQEGTWWYEMNNETLLCG